MIVVTLLLILVAVTLLVLGLADGSSLMLIGSIVASLLAAVALVIGARRAATQRRAAAGPSPAEAAPTEEFATAGARTSTGPSSAARTSTGPSSAARRSSGSFAAADSGPATDAGPGPRGTRTSQGARAADDFPPPPPPVAGLHEDFPPPPKPAARLHEDFPPPPGPAADHAPLGREDFLPPPPGSTEGRPDDDFAPPPAASAPAEPARGGRSRTDSAAPSARSGDDLDPSIRAGRSSERDVDSDFSASDPILDDEDDDLLDPEPGRRTPPPADYDRASSTIDAARAAGSEAWRTDPALTDPGTRTAEPLDDDAPLLLDDPEPPAGEAPAADGSAAPASSTGPAGPAGPADLAGSAGVPGSAGASGSAEEEFAEADDDDPEDEPLPQAVRPGDAVQVARMDAEVLVVDGRPRYHMADCPHLVGRLTEGLPVSEAVELGFNPCGLCRPVDRLVAHSAQR